MYHRHAGLATNVNVYFAQANDANDAGILAQVEGPGVLSQGCSIARALFPALSVAVSSVGVHCVRCTTEMRSMLI